ncbi:hypothetical protein SIAM614_05045 [Roseibium aggregatum IAM 12614]|uniref:Uncharacterized protein n=1 Tax=Roseibium aggregatum (strain ATCC 25650 / DSM 13394 / JCM 20685 / NBRC 16684 / NCIMB 2208 / IAM 12614 / B1) TaxID=384765 RepID=A0NSH2_ROSAI|nr:hypothetical protein SIAM614_05045 [Roseibium aggregatum IAM 12614]
MSPKQTFSAAAFNRIKRFAETVVCEIPL